MKSRSLSSTCRQLRLFLHSEAPQLRCRRARHSSVHFPTADDFNAFVSFAPDLKNNADGPLSGVKIGLKDNICTKDFKTTCSSAMLKDFVSPYDATVVRLLRDSGAQILGKTNCDEFGMGSHNVQSVHGPVLNPFGNRAQARDSKFQTSSEPRSAGGSSGGSAAAVASGSCSVALGTDTGGSVRLPASYCGVAGFKPSYGLISRWGIVAYADSLDCVGILARKTPEVRPVFDVLSKYDPKDPTSASEETRTRVARLMSNSRRTLSGLRLGVPKEYFPAELSDACRAPFKVLLERLRSAGAEIVPISLPATRFALSAYYVIASAEASSNLARYSGVHFGSRAEVPEGSSKKTVSDVYAHTRSQGFGPEVKKRILLGSYALSADAFDNYFLQAQRVRQLIKADFDRAFRAANPLHHSSSTDTQASSSARHGITVDAILHPSAVGPAPLLSETAAMSSLEAYVQDVLTVPASLAGLPALSVPMGHAEDGWPVGVSVVGQWGHDRQVLDIGDALEQNS